MVRHEEGELEGLLLVEAGVAEAGVVGRQVVLVEPLGAADALGDGVARELEVDAAKVAPLLLVDLERLLQLREDVVEAARLDARARRARVAVHGVALPDDAALVLAALDGADVVGQELAHLVGAVARDERDLAHLAARVQGAEQLQQVRDGRGGPDLDADGVGDAAEELDVGVVDLAGAVADPDEVGRGVVVLHARALARERVGRVLHTARQALLVLEQQALVAGEEVDGGDLGALVGADGVAEADHVGKETHGLRVLGLELRVLDVAQSPVKGPVQVGDARGQGGPDVVEGGGRVVVGLDQSLGVELAVVQVVAVEDVAAERRHLLPVDRLHGAGAGLGVLAGHAANTDDSLVGAPDEDQTHLQQQLDLGLDDALAAVVEELGAVASLQQEGLALGDIPQVLLELVDLVGVDNGRELLQLGRGLAQCLEIWVLGALLDRL